MTNRSRAALGFGGFVTVFALTALIWPVKAAAVTEMRRYLPALQGRDVRFGPSGIRAQLLSRDGSQVDDFLLEQDGRVLHVLNAPSPAATASLAIGRRVAAELH